MKKEDNSSILEKKRNSFVSFLPFLLIIVIILILGSFQSPFSNAKSTLLGNIVAPALPMPIKISPYCEKPIKLIRGVDPDIVGRYIAYQESGATWGIISVWDMGPNHRGGDKDDKGKIRLYSPQNSVIDTSARVSGINVVFRRLDLNTNQDHAMLYSFGKDGIPGNIDDIGPKSLVSIRAGNLMYGPYIFDSVVTYGTWDSVNSYQDFWCLTDIPSGKGSCFGNSHNKLKTTNPSVKKIVFGMGNKAKPSFLFEVQNSAKKSDIFSKTGSKELQLYNSPAISESLEDVFLGTFFVLQDINIGRSIKVGANTAKNFKWKMSNVFSFNDPHPRISHATGTNGEMFIVWQEKTNIIKIGTMGKRFEITLPFLGGPAHPDVEDNTVAFSNWNGDLFVTECFVP